MYLYLCMLATGEVLKKNDEGGKSHGYRYPVGQHCKNQ